jgi:hypothetical protein
MPSVFCKPSTPRLLFFRSLDKCTVAFDTDTATAISRSQTIRILSTTFPQYSLLYVIPFNVWVRSVLVKNCLFFCFLSNPERYKKRRVERELEKVVFRHRWGRASVRYIGRQHYLVLSSGPSFLYPKTSYFEENCSPIPREKMGSETSTSQPHAPL